MFVFRGPKALGPSVVFTMTVFAFSSLGVAANLARAVSIVMAGVLAFRTENIVRFGVVLLLISRLLVAVAAVASTARRGHFCCYFYRRRPGCLGPGSGGSSLQQGLGWKSHPEQMSGPGLGQSPK